MPHIAVTMYPGRTPEQKQRLAEKLRQTIMDELHVSAQVVSVTVQDVEQAHWAESLSQFPAESFFVKPEEP